MHLRGASHKAAGGRSPLVAFAMLCWLNALVLSIGIITASTVCGKCGMLFIVTESISVVNKPLG